MSERKIIYDFGSNNGDDIPYYLLRSDLVVAVEANPVLTSQIRKRFADEIASGKLVVENCVLADAPSAEKVPFYVHKTNHVLSTFPRPEGAAINQFEEIQLYPRTPSSIIKYYGAPYYVKIDIEHFDANILREILLNDIRPVYVSAEMHHIEVFALLVAALEYRSFKLVDGRSVKVKYNAHTIETVNGPSPYSFPSHSAGPFGNDITGPWMTADNIFKIIAKSGLGWKDIHASRVDVADPHFAELS